MYVAYYSYAVVVNVPCVPPKKTSAFLFYQKLTDFNNFW